MHGPVHLHVGGVTVNIFDTMGHFQQQMQTCSSNGLKATQVTLGVKSVGGVMTKVSNGDAVIPAKKSHIFSTYQDNHPAVNIQVSRV